MTFSFVHATAPLIGWFGDPGSAIGIGALSIWYAAGVRRVWAAAAPGRGVSRARAWYFGGAVCVLSIALLSPLDALSGALFSAHMTQHVLLAVVVPPLLVLGAPERVMLRALPLSVRRGAARTWMSARTLRRAWRAVTVPAVAWMLHAIATWTWHVPRLYELALQHSVVHAVEHLSFIITGVLLWWSILHARGERRAAYGVGIITIFGTAMHTGVLGALFALAPRAIYSAHAVGAASWGLTPLEDQQVAGLVMWVVGGLLYVVAMGGLFVAWLAPNKRRRVAQAVAAAGVVSAIGCQQSDATIVPGGNAQRGKEAIAAMGCGACHVIRGVPSARGEVGPPLNGIARRAIIGGTLPNTPDNLVLWIEDPPSIAPNTAMPNLGVTAQSARDIAAYLYTLK